MIRLLRTPALQAPRPHIVFLLHGLGAHPIVMLPLQMYLIRSGLPHVCALPYNVSTTSIEDSVQSAHEAMDRILRCKTLADRARWDVFLVGHSWGGLVANRLHTKGWVVRGAVYVASPLHGAYVLTTLERVLPTWLQNLLRRPAYGALRDKAVARHEGRRGGTERAPPHPYRTVSCGVLHTTFDGAVYRDEATLDPRFHTHLDSEGHTLVLLKERMYRVVLKGLHAMVAARGGSLTRPITESTNWWQRP